MDLKIEDIVEACRGNNAKLIFGKLNTVCRSFSKDTRTIKTGDVYVGIKGENFDGNSLYKEALEKGASVCVLQGVSVEDIRALEFQYKDRAIILVDDTIKALQEIACYKRNLYNIPVIAITGSVGKTSTKDIVASVVGTKYKVCKTEGNLNNHIGLPLTILGLNNHEALVVEMGMNNLGEISKLSKIAQPTIGIITNVGTAHIGNLGSRENIRKAKLEILDGMKENGILIINNDNDMLHDWYEEVSCLNEYGNEAERDSKKSERVVDGYNLICEKNIKVITYGIENSSCLMAENSQMYANSSAFELNINNLLNSENEFQTTMEKLNIQAKEISNFNKVKIDVPIGGMHFIYNALCATTVGILVNININSIILGIQNFELSKNRMEIVKLSNGATVINDCYNANYDSMKAGIEYLCKTAKHRKIAVLGDMLELGEFSNELHKKVGEEVLKNGVEVLITVGEMGKIIFETVQKCEIYNSSNSFMCENNEGALKILQEIIEAEDTILVKASNGMKFKEIVNGLTDMKF